MKRRMEHLLQEEKPLHSCKEFEKVSHKDLGATHKQHVSSLQNDEILKIEGGKEKEEHPKKKSIYPSMFQSLKEQRRQEDPCNKDRGKSVHLHSHPTLCLDASLQGGI